MTLEDVKGKDCVTLADELAGVCEDGIENLFNEADTNGDGIVMRFEVTKVFQRLAQDRCGEVRPCKEGDPRPKRE